MMKRILTYVGISLLFIFAVVTYPLLSLIYMGITHYKRRQIKLKIKELEDKILKTKELWEKQSE